jgi:hypothetical protein
MADTLAGREFPIALLARVGFVFRSTDTLDVATARRGRHNVSGFGEDALELFSAGAIGEQTSFDLAGAIAADSGTFRTRRAFVRFGDLARPAGTRLDVSAGVFDAEWPFLSDARRTTFHHYLAPVSIAARGIELDGVRATWSGGAGLIDSGREPANDKPGLQTFNRLEDTYLWTLAGCGPRAVAARVWFDRQDSNLPVHTWLQHVQAMAGASVVTGRFTIVPAYVQDRYDDRPTPGIHDKHHFMMLETLARLGSSDRWAATARYEHEYHTRTPVTREEDRQEEVINLTYYASAYSQIAVEWSRDANNVGDPQVDSFDARVTVTR